MHRFRSGVLAAAAGASLVIALAGCSSLSPATTATTPPPVVTTASVRAGGLVLSLRIASATPRANSAQIATVTVTNTSDTTSPAFSNSLPIRIITAHGATVYDTSPAGMPRPVGTDPRAITLAPHASVTGVNPFRVPPPGFYRIEGRVWSDLDPSPSPSQIRLPNLFPEPVSLLFDALP